MRQSCALTAACLLRSRSVADGCVSTSLRDAPGKHRVITRRPLSDHFVPIMSTASVCYWSISRRRVQLKLFYFNIRKSSSCSLRQIRSWWQHERGWKAMKPKVNSKSWPQTLCENIKNKHWPERMRKKSSDHLQEISVLKCCWLGFHCTDEHD